MYVTEARFEGGSGEGDSNGDGACDGDCYGDLRVVMMGRLAALSLAAEPPAPKTIRSADKDRQKVPELDKKQVSRGRQELPFLKLQW